MELIAVLRSTDTTHNSMLPRSLNAKKRCLDTLLSELKIALEEGHLKQIIL